MVLFLKFQMKGQRAKTMSSQPQLSYQLWPLPCALFPCLWLTWFSLLLKAPTSPCQRSPADKDHGPQVQKSTGTHSVTVVRCVCFSHFNTQACVHCVPRAKQWLYTQLTLPISEQTRKMLIEIRLWDLIMTTPVDLSLFQTKNVTLEKVCS